MKDDSEQEPDDLHAGYTPEEGILSRVREWTDVLGWLRLGRILRLAGSPTAIAIVAVTLAIWLLGIHVIGTPVTTALPTEMDDSFGSSQVSAVMSIVRTFGGATPSSILDRATSPQGSSPQGSSPQGFWGKGFWGILIEVAWSVLLWTPVALMLMRQGALLTAGRNLDGAKSVIRLAIRRTPYAWLIAIVPLACGLAIGLLIAAVGLISRVSMGLEWIEFVFAVIVAVVALLGGILLFGANFAVPLGMAAIVNEPQPDSLDSLSRGYEYLYRRPLQLALYVAISIVPLWVVARLSVGVATSATHLSERMLTAAGTSQELISTTSVVLALFPIAVAITLVGGLIGGVYLLLRSDAGGQEVEDIWMPTSETKLLLPSLPVDDDVSSQQTRTQEYSR